MNNRRVIIALFALLTGVSALNFYLFHEALHQHLEDSHKGGRTDLGFAAPVAGSPPPRSSPDGAVATEPIQTSIPVVQNPKEKLTKPGPERVPVEDSAASGQHHADSRQIVPISMIHFTPIDVPDVVAYVAGRPGQAQGVVLQSAVTGAILHPVMMAAEGSGVERRSNAERDACSSSTGPQALRIPLGPHGTGCVLSQRQAQPSQAAPMLADHARMALVNLSVAKRHHASPPVSDLRLQAAHFGTFLSRDVHNHRLTMDKVAARSMESWGLVRTADAAPPTYELRGIPHEFQPDGADLCATAATASDNRYAPLVMAPRSNPRTACDRFIVWAPESPSSGGNAMLEEPPAKSEQDPAPAPAVAVRLAVGLSIRASARFNSSRQRFSDGVVLDNWLRLLHEAEGRPVAVSLALCLDTPDDIPLIAAAAERFGFSQATGQMKVLGFGEALPPVSVDKAATRIVVSAHCEKHPLFKQQPTYRGVFALAEYVLTRSATAEAATVPLPPSFVLFANSDVLVDAADLFRTLLAVRDAAAADPSPRPVLISGRRWNCGHHHVQKGLKLHKKKKRSRGGAQQDGPTYADTFYLSHHCSLFGDNAQDYFVIRAGALLWGPPVGLGLPAPPALVSADIPAAFAAKDNTAVAMEYYADVFAPAAAYRRALRADRWSGAKHRAPPFVVGGIAFDNWFVSEMMGQRRSEAAQRAGRLPAWVVDATAAIYVFHINHDGNSRFESHKQPKSAYNKEMAHYCNGWSEGKVGASPIAALRAPAEHARHQDPGTVTLLHRRGVVHCPAPLTASDCALPPAPLPARTSFDDEWDRT